MILIKFTTKICIKFFSKYKNFIKYKSIKILKTLKQKELYIFGYLK